MSLVREFMEEALDSTETGKKNTRELRTMVQDFFRDGVEVAQSAFLAAYLLLPAAVPGLCGRPQEH